ncbi:hypothetical protein CC1G_09169 [Coprinopsis cinerea okayama7|uniref:Uncharacterized protein n=1 Tax=Coprinopsis cinerea (strain Okayama-7 / 130 / ATCC MYA-4618 / FGSC 9003) TaxID=240176 RepID=A8P9T6_COPC7|nr:hypothetical protein CC1G_09169 [Coprinopsis cinerea okayama7\|eukprot:XP_001839835.1 hypothetical protein CC1G_09169 [Coprinopsis cinerea okayama7\
MSINKYRLYIAFYTRDYPPPQASKYDMYDVGLLFLPKGADIASPEPVARSWTAYIDRNGQWVLDESKVRSRQTKLVGLVFLDKVANPKDASRVFANMRWRTIGCHDWVIKAIDALVAAEVVTDLYVKAVRREEILKTGFTFVEANLGLVKPSYVPTCHINGTVIKSALEGF